MYGRKKKRVTLRLSTRETRWEEYQKIEEMFKGSPKTIGFRHWRQNLDHLFCEFFVSSKHSMVRFYSLSGLQV